MNLYGASLGEIRGVLTAGSPEESNSETSMNVYPEVGTVHEPGSPATLYVRTEKLPVVGAALEDRANAAVRTGRRSMFKSKGWVQSTTTYKRYGT